MEDCIYRKEATEFIDKCLNYEEKLQSVERETLIAVKKYLESIPPVDVSEAEQPKWTPADEKKPSDFVSVQAHMTDAGLFPSVREAYVVDGEWFVPALGEFHPVDRWMPFAEPGE